MSSVEYHGWTHRTKAEGGTDPIWDTAPGGTGLPVAVASDGSNSQSVTDPWYPTFDTFWTNDDTIFTVENVSAGKFGYIGLNVEGLYMARLRIAWGTVFSSVNVYIEPIYEASGTPTPMGNSVDFLDFVFDGNTPIVEQIATGELVHKAVVATQWFHYDASFVGETPLKIAQRLRCPSGGTKFLGATLVIVKFGDLMTRVTSF